MGIWVGVGIFVVVLLVGGLLVARGGQASRAARRELRQERKASGRTVNAAEISRQRRAMQADPIPGSSAMPGGI